MYTNGFIIQLFSLSLGNEEENGKEEILREGLFGLIREFKWWFFFFFFTRRERVLLVVVVVGGCGGSALLSGYGKCAWFRYSAAIDVTEHISHVTRPGASIKAH